MLYIFLSLQGKNIYSHHILSQITSIISVRDGVSIISSSLRDSLGYVEESQATAHSTTLNSNLAVLCIREHLAGNRSTPISNNSTPHDLVRVSACIQLQRLAAVGAVRCCD